MWIWDKLTKVKVVRTQNQLKVKSFQPTVSLTILMILSFVLAIRFSELGQNQIGDFFLIMVPVTLFLSLALGITSEVFNKNNFLIKDSKIQHFIIVLGIPIKITTTHEKPFFINMMIKPKRNSIRIRIENMGNFIGYYTLKKSGNLTQFIDGLVELLDLELFENRQLSKVEILTFKSRNAKIPNKTTLQINLSQDYLSLKSTKDETLWVDFDFQRGIVKKYDRIIAVDEIRKIDIQQTKNYYQIIMELKSAEKLNMMKISSSEINILRDTSRIKETLENRQELQGIEIELIEKR